MAVGVQIGSVFIHDTENEVPPDAYGSRYKLKAIDGWFDGWEGTGQAEQRSQADGAWITPQYAGPRIVHVTGLIEDGSWDAVTRAWDRLLGQVPFRALADVTVSTGGGTVEPMVVAARQHEKPLLSERHPSTALFSLSLLAPDPRRYATTAQTTVLVLPLASGGIAPPLTPPLTITGSTTVSTATLTNAGTVDTYPVLSIAGPCPPCTITNLTTSEALRVVDAVPAGQTLVIDVGAGTALIQGQSRKVLGTWWSLQPGDNQVSFVADSYDAGAALTITHRSAWK